MNPTWKNFVYKFARILLALSFLVAGGLKIANPMTFAATVNAFGILPGPLVLPVAIILPVLEVIGALALLADLRGSLGLIAVMLLLFITVLGYGQHMGLDIDCGCYGPTDPEAEAFSGIKSALIRDAVMLAGVTLLYVLRSTLSIRPRQWSRSFLSTSFHKDVRS